MLKLMLNTLALNICLFKVALKAYFCAIIKI